MNACDHAGGKRRLQRVETTPTLFVVLDNSSVSVPGAKQHQQVMRCIVAPENNHALRHIFARGIIQVRLLNSESCCVLMSILLTVVVARAATMALVVGIMSWTAHDEQSACKHPPKLMLDLT